MIITSEHSSDVQLEELVTKLSSGLQEKQLKGRTLTLKLKASNFEVCRAWTLGLAGILASGRFGLLAVHLCALVESSMHLQL